MLAPSHVFAQGFIGQKENVQKANVASQDLEKVLKKNDAISQTAQELKNMLEQNGQKVRDKETFLTKMREFLSLITDNKITYLGVLNDRINNNKAITETEKNTALNLLDTDMTFYQEKQAAIQSLNDWENLRKIGNEIQNYSEKITPRLRGLAGLRLVQEATALVERAKKISAKLSENITKFERQSSVQGVESVSSEPSSGSDTSESFNFDAALEDLDAFVADAQQNVTQAKESFMEMVELKDSTTDQKPIEYLKEAHLDLKSARKTSVTITIELIKSTIE